MRRCQSRLPLLPLFCRSCSRCRSASLLIVVISTLLADSNVRAIAVIAVRYYVFSLVWLRRAGMVGCTAEPLAINAGVEFLWPRKEPKTERADYPGAWPFRAPACTLAAVIVLILRLRLLLLLLLLLLLAGPSRRESFRYTRRRDLDPRRVVID